MGGLGRRAVMGALLGTLVVLSVGLAAGAVRLLPWVLAPEVPLEVALPFARALGAAATEAALVIGAPVGVALAAASSVERGEARALFALGASPARIAASLSPALALFGLVAAVASLAWGSSADVPGRFAVDLVARGRASCARASAPKSAQVPLVGVTWLCFPGVPPRVAGTLPGLGGTAWFTAAAFVPSEDLREVRLEDLKVFTKKLDDRVRLELSVREATVRGLPGWGRSARLAFHVRSVLAATTAVALALAAAWSVLRLGVTRRVAALGLGGAPSLSAFVLQTHMDGSAPGPGAYALVPVAGLLVALLVASVGRRLGGRSSAFRRLLGPS